MIEPMPKLRLKNAWPIAVKKVLVVILEKSGANRKDKAFKNSPFNTA